MGNRFNKPNAPNFVRAFISNEIGDDELGLLYPNGTEPVAPIDQGTFATIDGAYNAFKFFGYLDNPRIKCIIVCYSYTNTQLNTYPLTEQNYKFITFELSVVGFISFIRPIINITSTSLPVRFENVDIDAQIINAEVMSSATVLSFLNVSVPRTTINVRVQIIASELEKFQENSSIIHNEGDLYMIASEFVVNGNNNFDTIIENEGNITSHFPAIDLSEIEENGSELSFIQNIDNGRCLFESSDFLIDTTSNNLLNNLNQSIKSNNKLTLIENLNINIKDNVELNDVELDLDIPSDSILFKMETTEDIPDDMLPFNFLRCDICSVNDVILTNTTNYSLLYGLLENVFIPKNEYDIKNKCGTRYNENCIKSRPNVITISDGVQVANTTVVNTPKKIKNDYKINVYENDASIYYIDASNNSIKIKLPLNPPNGYILKFKRMDDSDNEIIIYARIEDKKGIKLGKKTLDIQFFEDRYWIL